MLYHKQAIENYPLQAYKSGLIFSPKGSLIRRHFQHKDHQLIQIRPDTVDDWGACLQTLEGHSDLVSSVAVSGDSRWVVTGSDDNTAKIWDAGSGRCLQTLDVGKAVLHISFDVSGKFVKTEISPIFFRALSESLAAADTQISNHIPGHSLGLSGNSKWITIASKEHIWLPTEYRPSCSAASAELLAFGVGSGRVWLCTTNM
jgi:WD40 repeat protein